MKLLRSFYLLIIALWYAHNLAAAQTSDLSNTVRFINSAISDLQASLTQITDTQKMLKKTYDDINEQIINKINSELNNTILPKIAEMTKTNDFVQKQWAWLDPLLKTVTFSNVPQGINNIPPIILQVRLALAEMRNIATTFRDSFAFTITQLDPVKDPQGTFANLALAEKNFGQALQTLKDLKNSMLQL